MSLVCCQLHLSHLVNLTHGLHFCFLVFVLVIFISPPPPLFLLFQSFSGSSCFLFVDPVFFSVFFSCGVFIALARWVRLPSKLPYYFVIFCKLYFVVCFRSVFSFLNLELFVTVPLFKVPWKRTGQSCPKRRDREWFLLFGHGQWQQSALSKDFIFLFTFALLTGNSKHATSLTC